MTLSTLDSRLSTLTEPQRAAGMTTRGENAYRYGLQTYHQEYILAPDPLDLVAEGSAARPAHHVVPAHSISVDSLLARLSLRIGR